MGKEGGQLLKFLATSLSTLRCLMFPKSSAPLRGILEVCVYLAHTSLSDLQCPIVSRTGPALDLTEQRKHSVVSPCSRNLLYRVPNSPPTYFYWIGLTSPTACCSLITLTVLLLTSFRPSVHTGRPGNADINRVVTCTGHILPDLRLY